MEFLLKSSAIIAIVYICYKFLLQNETFFNSNRWFLLLGLIASVAIPFIVIPIYIEYVPVATPVSIPFQEAISSQPQIENGFNVLNLIPLVYSIGVVFFLGKLTLEFASLFQLIKKHAATKNGSYTYVETDAVNAPFSFFHWIFYNSKLFDRNELQLIMYHEKVHARQCHSLDVILAQLACIVLWFNPIMWLYKKALLQNLEFIADQEVQSITVCVKSYQNLLLKTSISNHQLALTNNFYNSLIKKRIVMLHTSKSNKLNAWKYSLVLPILALFVFNFNTEIIAQTPKNNTQNATKIGQNILKFIISKDTSDKQLELIKKNMKEKDVVITFDDVKRNSKNEITAININYESKISKGNHVVNSDNPINPFEISLNVDEQNLTVGQAARLTQSFDIVKEEGDTKLIKTEVNTKEEEGEDIIIIKKDKDGKTSKDTVYIKKDVIKVVRINEDGTEVKINASENGNNYSFRTQSGNQPLIIVDGEETQAVKIKNINPNHIESVTVFKEQKNIESYGKKGENGVIIISTKNDASFNGVEKNIVIESEQNNPWAISSEVKVVTTNDGNEPMEYSSSIITKKTTDTQLDMHKKHLKSEGVLFNYSKLKRNKAGDIVRIKIELSDEEGKKKMASFTNDDGISQIMMGIKNDKIFLYSN